jgi:hypothetical protein
VGCVGGFLDIHQHHGQCRQLFRREHDSDDLTTHFNGMKLRADAEKSYLGQFEYLHRSVDRNELKDGKTVLDTFGSDVASIWELKFKFDFLPLLGVSGNDAYDIY